MNEEQGLAQRGQQASSDEMLRRVVQMLMQGAQPEELLQQGIPQELIEMAMQILMKQHQQETAIAPEQEGLAGMHLQQGT